MLRRAGIWFVRHQLILFTGQAEGAGTPSIIGRSAYLKINNMSDVISLELGHP